MTLSTDGFGKSEQRVLGRACTSTAVNPPSPVHDLCEGRDFAVEGVRASLWLCLLHRGLSKGSALRGDRASWQQAPRKSQGRAALELCCGWQALGWLQTCAARAGFCSGCFGSGAGSRSLCFVGFCKANVVISVPSFFCDCWVTDASEIPTGFKLSPFFKRN